MSKREEIARAIEDAELGYDLKLTRLVDGVSTYTLKYEGAVVALEFGSYEEASEHLRNYRNELRADAVLSVLAEPDERMIEAAVADWHDRDVMLLDEGMGQTWRAMIAKAREG